MQTYKIILKNHKNVYMKKEKFYIADLFLKIYVTNTINMKFFPIRTLIYDRSICSHEYVYEICVTKSRKQSYHIAHLEFNSKSRAQRGTKYTHAYTAVTLLEMLGECVSRSSRRYNSWTQCRGTSSFTKLRYRSLAAWIRGFVSRQPCRRLPLRNTW